jgi:hypothetical protein
LGSNEENQAEDLYYIHEEDTMQSRKQAGKVEGRLTAIGKISLSSTVTAKYDPISERHYW